MMDNSAGDYATDKVYDDAKVEDIESLPDTAPHRPVDIEVTKADIEGEQCIVRSIRSCPCSYMRLIARKPRIHTDLYHSPANYLWNR